VREVADVTRAWRSRRKGSGEGSAQQSSLVLLDGADMLLEPGSSIGCDGCPGRNGFAILITISD
jgi:hypothetical protein